MSRRQNNQRLNEIKVNDISICNSNEISNAYIISVRNSFQLQGLD